MYTYTAAGNRTRCVSAPVDGRRRVSALFERLRDPATREKIKAEVQVDSDKWETFISRPVRRRKFAGGI